MSQIPDSNGIEKEKSAVSTVLTRSKALFEESPTSEEDLASINRLAPARLTADQVYVRSMYLCSSQPCLSDGCQFTKCALEEIAQKIIGLSVLIGHDRTSLPLARFFKAQVVQRHSDDPSEPVFFVRAWFYWLRNTSGAKDLLFNIDGGIYREVSLAWKYDAWRCSICHAPNGTCGHRVGATYNNRQCFRQIEHITDVLEGSLVYKSADKNTTLTGARSLPGESEASSVLLIAWDNDPLYRFLKQHQIIEELADPDALDESLRASADHLWIRCESNSFMQERIRQLMAENGVCLGEVVAPRDSPFPVEGNVCGFAWSAKDAVTRFDLATQEG